MKRSARFITISEPATKVMKALTHLRRDERGLSTAEYAVGTVAVAGLGGVLIKILTSDAAKELIWTIILSAFKAITG
ncbi:MAG: DUF4244 domain-containing protein [Actinomycetales bacterium]|nr:DUF4244 domain-containing protein [Actinomycetales bacterium]